MLTDMKAATVGLHVHGSMFQMSPGSETPMDFIIKGLLKKIPTAAQCMGIQLLYGACLSFRGLAHTNDSSTLMMTHRIWFYLYDH